MSKIKKILVKVFGFCMAIVGLVVGSMVGKYLGLVLAFPVLGGVISYLILRKIIRPISRPILPASVVLSAQLLWLIAGLVLKGTLDSGIMDAIIIIAGLTWLIIRHSRASVIFLAIYQGIGFVLNLFGIIAVDFGTGGHKTLLANLILKMLSIILLTIALKGSESISTVKYEAIRLKGRIKMKYKNFILTVIALLLLALVLKSYFIEDTRNLLKDNMGEEIYVDMKRDVAYSMLDKDGEWIGAIRIDIKKAEIKSALVFDKTDYKISSVNIEALLLGLDRLTKHFDKLRDKHK